MGAIHRLIVAPAHKRLLADTRKTIKRAMRLARAGKCAHAGDTFDAADARIYKAEKAGFTKRAAQAKKLVKQAERTWYRVCNLP